MYIDDLFWQFESGPPDLEALENSEAYQCFCVKFMKRNVYKELKGFRVTIDGDIDRMILTDRDSLIIHVIYSLRGGIQGESKIAEVLIKDEEMKRKLLQIGKTDTRIQLIGEYNGMYGSFDLIEILSMATEMRFGHFVCPKCKHDYGRQLSGSNFCGICDGPKVQYVTDFYDKKLHVEDNTKSVKNSLALEILKKVKEKLDGCICHEDYPSGDDFTYIPYEYYEEALKALRKEFL